MKEIKVMTDCGEITVQEYDDEIANGVKIFLGDTIVAMVDCYRKKGTGLPKELYLTTDILRPDETVEESIRKVVFNLYDTNLYQFNYSIDGRTIQLYNITWDRDVLLGVFSKQNPEIPEARLLVYGPEGPDFDEPQEIFRLN